MSTETTEPTETVALAPEAAAEAAQAEAETAPVATIDPNYSGPIGPGVIADQAAYDAAVASGRLVELSPSPPLDAAVNGAARAVPVLGAALGLTTEETDAQITQLVEQQKRKDAVIADAQAELDELRAAYERLRRTAEATAEQLRANVLAQQAPVVHETDERQAVFTDRGRLAALVSAPVNGFAAPQPARKRRRKFDIDLDKRQDGPASFLQQAIGTLGLPRIWARVAAAVVPAAGVAARELVQSLDADSPGGARITRDELEEIAELAAERLKRELLEEFIRG